MFVMKSKMEKFSQVNYYKMFIVRTSEKIDSMYLKLLLILTIFERKKKHSKFN